MCILLLELASNSLWLCNSKINFSTSENDNVSSYVKNNLRGGIIYPSTSDIIYNNSYNYSISETSSSSNNDTIKNSFYQIISEPSPSSSNEKLINEYSEEHLEHSPSSSNEKLINEYSEEHLEPSSSDSNKKLINEYSEKNLEPSSSDSNEQILEPSSSTRKIILNEYQQGIKEPSSSNISLTKKNINIKSIDNLYLHFIWILLPIIIIIVCYRKKKYNKFKKIGIDCIKYKNKKLKRCKSMPNIYQFLPPVILQERRYSSDTEIEL